jgi:hypothetical protein
MQSISLIQSHPSELGAITSGTTPRAADSIGQLEKAKKATGCRNSGCKTPRPPPWETATRAYRHTELQVIAILWTGNQLFWLVTTGTAGSRKSVDCQPLVLISYHSELVVRTNCDLHDQQYVAFKVRRFHLAKTIGLDDWRKLKKPGIAKIVCEAHDTEVRGNNQVRAGPEHGA